MAAADVLRGSALFRGFTDTGVQIFAAISRERAYPSGTPIFVEDMVADALYVIGEGRVRISARTPDGEDAPLAEVGPGECLGVVSLVGQGKRLCSATAVTPVSALELRQVDFQRLLSQKPQACLKLLLNALAEMGRRLADNQESLRAFIASRTR